MTKPTAKPTPEKPAETAPQPSITVVGPAEGRRRIGRRFGPEKVIIPLDELTKAEIAALRADKRLAVSGPE